MQEQYRVALVGCGGISNAWLGAMAKIPDLKVVALVDQRLEAAKAQSEKWQLPEAKLCTSLTEALAATRPEVVFDLTIPAAHEAVTTEALKAGCHVLGEKPLADTLEAAQRMVAAAKASGKTYAIIQNRRYEAGIRSVRQTLESGAIGEVEELHSDFFVGAHFGGFRDEMEDVLILDMAIHTFDAARYISGADPVSVYCESWNPKHSWYRGHASAMCIFEMSGGVRYTYRGSWCNEGMHTSWEADWRIAGSKGTILWDGGKNIRGQMHKPGAPATGFFREMVEVPVQTVAMEHLHHAAQIRDYVDCLKTGRRPMTHGEDNIRSLAMVMAAVKSRKLGQKVAVEW